MNSTRLLVLLACALMFGSTACADVDVHDVKAKLLKARPNLPIEGVRAAELPGFVQVNLVDGHMLYVSEDAKYFIAGDLYRVDATDFVNLSDEERNVSRKSLIDSLDEGDMLVFAPEGRTKATVTVFTDIDCGYCRKLHQEVPELNELGIAVRYLAYPRAGIDSDSYNKIVSAWCAKDPLDAMTKAKQGKAIPTRRCDNPVARQYALGGQLGVTGTPTLIYDNGFMQGGYMPAKMLAARLGLKVAVPLDIN